MSDIKVTVASLTDVGKARELNEDSSYAGARVFAVADGLGGHRAGEVASGIAVEAIRPLDQSFDSDGISDALTEAVREANRKIYEKQQVESDHRGMASTVTAIAVDGSRAHMVHVGDSRCYLIRDGSISQISQDHTLVARMVAEGKLTLEQAEYHPQRSIVTRALGASPDVDVDTLEIELYGGDRLLLCSDGLTAVLNDQELYEFISKARDLDETCKALVDEANARGGPDNITVVLLEVSGPRRREEAPQPEPQPVKQPVPKRAPARKVPARLLVWLGVLLVVVVGAWIGVRSWVNGSWYVGLDGARVAIFQGLPTDTLGGILHHAEQRTDITVDEVAPFYRPRLAEGLTVANREKARELVARIPRATPAPTVAASPAPKPSGTP